LSKRPQPPHNFTIPGNDNRVGYAAPRRRAKRSTLEEYAPVAFGALLLIGAFAFAGHQLGRTAVANTAPYEVAEVAEIKAPAVAPVSADLTKGALLPDGEAFEILNTKILDSQIIDKVGKSDFVIEDPKGLDEANAPSDPALQIHPDSAPTTKVAVRTPKKVKIEPAAIDLEEEAKMEKPVKKVVLAPVPAKPKAAKVTPEKEEKTAKAEKPLPQSKADKQREVAQRRIRLAEENCLARAIYFEARGESEMGQLAVAKVIINRTKSPRFPKTICGVVYQGSQNRNSCQFSFACDGHADDVKQPASWSQAKRVAHKALQGGHELQGLKAVNYHADYVKPKWSKTMRRLSKIGRHIFYGG
jgi:spore germination cell wall hydrolase CwlJ-like protein